VYNVNFTFNTLKLSKVIKRLPFYTKNGKSSQKYGAGNGRYSMVSAPSNGAELISFSGRSGGLLDAIQLVWKSTLYVSVNNYFSYFISHK